MSRLPVPAGDPASLHLAVDRYAATQAAIEKAADGLMAAMIDGDGRAMDALGESTADAESGMLAAHRRYEGTTAALRAYAVDLAHFHDRAHASMERESHQLQRLDWAERAVAEAAHALRQASLHPDAPLELEHAQREWWNATSQRDAVRGDLEEARSAYASAEAEWNDAAQVAIGRIVASFDGTNDGFMDHVGHTFAFAGEALTVLVRWATEFLAGVLQAVASSVEVYLRAVAFSIALLALVAVLVTAVSLAIAALVVVLGIVIGALLSLLTALSSGVAIYDLTEALGIGGLAQIRLVLAAACAVSPLLAVVVVTRLVDEAGKPPPTVRRLWARDSEDRAALRRLDTALPANSGDVLAWAGLVDQIGGDQRAVVDIAKVTQEDGSVGWIVTVPSTKDWVILGDQPAPNDLDAGIALLAFPELRTQYERGVLDAMAQAGIPPGDPVLLSGWSLGGIGSGRLIESDAGGYNYQGLIGAGSPIDHMAIPSHVAVLQVKHTRDVVHRADLIDGLPDTARHLSLWDGPRSGGAAPLQANPIAAHSNAAYVETLRANTAVDNSASSLFSAFYAVDDPDTAARPHVEHTQFAFSEQGP